MPGTLVSHAESTHLLFRLPTPSSLTSHRLNVTLPISSLATYTRAATSASIEPFQRAALLRLWWWGGLIGAVDV